MCKYMRKIEDIFDFLSHKELEKIKATVCGTLCNGECRKEFLESINKNKTK